jgi:antitoxin (DNA-binding transcriptional repressor) of toxin-antitoxin stability system
MSVATITVHKAKTTLSRLIERALAGEEIIIARGAVPAVRLVPFGKPVPKRKFGAMRGRAKVTRAFFQRLPPDELEAWGES